MEYLLAILGLGIMSGCALGAYAVLDVMEREHEEDRTPATVRMRALWPHGATSSSRRFATLRPPVRLEHALPHVGAGDSEMPRDLADREPWDTVAVYADWLDGRVQDLEERLDRFVREYPRVEAPGGQSPLTGVSGL